MKIIKTWKTYDYLTDENFIPILSLFLKSHMIKISVISFI